MADRVSSLTPDYTWSDASHRYRDLSTGRFVGPDAVRGALDHVIESSKSEMRAVSGRLRSGEIALADWQRGMAQEMKLIHTASAAAARGGWAEMSQSDWGAVGQQTRAQYEFLRNFAGDVATGKQPLDGRFLRRAEMYGEAARATYAETERRMMRREGEDEERRILGAADHCPDCLAAAALKWQPIGTLPRIGESQCRTRCRCSFDYRTVEEALAA